MSTSQDRAPELQVEQWFNSPQPISLQALRGRIVVLHAFQMLCPGCVAHGLPQATAISETFPRDEVVVLGLHSVFEHHAAMPPLALQAFLQEYRIGFPVGVDRPAPSGPVPLTMQAYGLRGTPSLVLVDRLGSIRLHHFGRMDDLRLGAMIGALRVEPVAEREALRTGASVPHCDGDACALTES